MVDFYCYVLHSNKVFCSKPRGLFWIESSSLSCRPSLNCAAVMLASGEKCGFPAVQALATLGAG
ncbi:hypothetical protein BSY15_2341 [Acidovorax sp. RAC01]|nr:hypothetical protein BSY15_2341 [Acidovorax sp. RAC01]